MLLASKFIFKMFAINLSCFTLCLILCHFCLPHFFLFVLLAFHFCHLLFIYFCNTFLFPLSFIVMSLSVWLSSLTFLFISCFSPYRLPLFLLIKYSYIFHFLLPASFCYLSSLIDDFFISFLFFSLFTPLFPSLLTI